MSLGSGRERETPQRVGQPQDYPEDIPAISWRARRDQMNEEARRAEYLLDHSNQSVEYHPSVEEHAINFAIFPGPLVVAGAAWVATHHQEAMRLVNVLVTSVGGQPIFGQ